MNDLAVFDLDGTLIAGDSFRRAISALLATEPLVVALALGRIVGATSRAHFAEQAHKAYLRRSTNAERDGYAVALAAAVVEERFRKVAVWRDRGAATLLLSASPEDYVTPLGKLLGFDYAAGSHWADGRYVHMHGRNKVVYLEQAFPAHGWRRAYAISDSASDDPLLALFAERERVPSLPAR